MTKIRINSIKDDLNSDFFSIKEIYLAFLNCKKHKKSINVLKFEFNLEENLLILLKDLNSNSYEISRAIVFIVSKPKIREIWASDFRDRIVHHLITRKIEIYYENKNFNFSFLDSSFANRKNKGTHKAIGLVKKYLNLNKYYLKLDIRSFFNSIDRGILFNILNNDLKKINFENKAIILSLFEKVIFHEYTKNYLKKYNYSNKNFHKKVPYHKSLFSSESNNCGLPIGNLTSQFLSNVYLNKLDYYVEKELKLKFYLRYVDDFIIFSNNLKQLKFLINDINFFLKKNLKLELHPDKIELNKTENGINFLGYYLKKNYILVRRNVVLNLKEKLYLFFLNKKNHRLNRIEILELQNMINSYFGHFKFANSYNLKYKMAKKLTEYFNLEKKKDNIILKLKNNLDFKNFREQYLYFKNKYKNHLIIFQMGVFYRFFDEYAEFMSNKVGLKTQIKIYSHKRYLICGFPLNSKKYFKLIEELNINFVIIEELNSVLVSGLKERQEKLIVSNRKDLQINSGFQIESKNLKSKSLKTQSINSNELILELIREFKKLKKEINLTLLNNKNEKNKNKEKK